MEVSPSSYLLLGWIRTTPIAGSLGPRTRTRVRRVVPFGVVGLGVRSLSRKALRPRSTPTLLTIAPPRRRFSFRRVRRLLRGTRPFFRSLRGVRMTPFSRVINRRIVRRPRFVSCTSRRRRDGTMRVRPFRCFTSPRFVFGGTRSLGTPWRVRCRTRGAIGRSLGSTCLTWMWWRTRGTRRVLRRWRFSKLGLVWGLRPVRVGRPLRCPW